MVTELDTRARQAASAIHAAVERAEPRLLHQRPLPRLRAIWVLAGRLVLVLSKGWNTARFTAQDHAGNESEATVTMRYSPVEASTTTEPPTTITEEKQLAAFEAYATFGACAEEPPYDVYYGHGQPGSTVSVKSEYGSGETLVNQEGEWELKVFFQGMTPGQTIVVKARDEFGREKLLEFTFQP